LNGKTTVTNGVIPVKTGIQNPRIKNPWIPAGVYPDENRGRNDSSIQKKMIPPAMMKETKGLQYPWILI